MLPYIIPYSNHYHLSGTDHHAQNITDLLYTIWTWTQ